MRIGYVVPGGVDRSGTHRVIPHLLERLAWMGRRHRVRVVALGQEPRPGRWTVEGVEVWNVGRRPRRLGALRALAALHRAEPFDVLHAFALVPQGVVARAAARLLVVPAVLEAPGGEFASLPDIGFGGWRRLPGRLWIRLALGAGPLVVPTEAARAVATRRGVDARVVPLEIDLERWPAPGPVTPADPEAGEHGARPATGPIRTAGSPPRRPRLCWVGTLNRVKDPETLLDVAGSLVSSGRDLDIDVVGEDVRGGALRDEARRRGLGGHLRFHGFLPTSELRPLLAAADLLVSTSRFEAAGRVVLEAATQGVPAVGFSTGQIADWHPEAARAVSPPTAEALAREVDLLLDDADRRRTLAREARRAVRAHDVDHVGRAWEALYQGLRPSSRAPGSRDG